MPVMSSQMGASRPLQEDPSEPIDESIFLTPDQIKSMSEEQIQAHLQVLNALRSAPRTPRAPKVDKEGNAAPKARDRGII